MHLGLFRSFIFIRSRDMAKKQKKKIFFKFLQRSIMNSGRTSSHLFLSEAEIWPKNEKKYFEILTQQTIHCAAIKKDAYEFRELSIFTNSRDMAKKQKKIFLKFNNIALCGIQNRCIWAYSKLYFYQMPRLGQKTKKNILKFNNITLYDIQNK
ncbi:hypothetical protein PUN28_009744 [Cardiocondyla obscurior]|uniref:Uncharacterized protein n=1 Tax=Cardiocondyla obscurior TaxID=286306 RepID=A0AAW2FMP4_9HYME